MTNCILCGCEENSFIPFFSNSKILVVRCPNCNLIFQLNPNLVNYIQSKTKYNEENLAFRRSIRSELFRVARQRLNWITHFSNSKRLLEIGGATGEFCSVAAEQGWNVELLELSAPFIKEAKDKFGLNPRSEILENTSFSNSSFDWVVLFHVFEHLPDPLKALEKISELLDDNGCIAIILPNVNSFTDNIWFEKNLNLNMEDHLFHFSPETLKKMLNFGGFDILELRTHEPSHHWITTLIFWLKVLFNSQTGDYVEVSPTQNHSNRKYLLPYFLGTITSPITWPLRKIIEITNQGHEILCIAKKRGVNENSYYP